MNRGREGCGRAAQPFERHGPGQLGRLHSRLRLQQGEHTDRRRRLRSVDEGKSLLLPHAHRLESRSLHRPSRRLRAVRAVDQPLADETAGHVRQRSEIAAGSNRTEFGDHRIDPGAQQREKEFDDFASNAGVAASQRVGAQQDDRPPHLRAQGASEAARVTADQVLLDLEPSCRRHQDLGQPAEAGGHAVDPFASGEGALDDAARGFDGGSGGGSEPDLALRAMGDPRDGFEGEAAAIDLEHTGLPPPRGRREPRAVGG